MVTIANWNSVIFKKLRVVPGRGGVENSP